MTNKTFTFSKSNQYRWPQVMALANNAIQKAFDSNKEFQIEIGKIKKEKTLKQLNGIHKLIQIISKQLTEWGNPEYSKDMVKQVVKHKAGFVKDLNGISAVRSFKDATLQELKHIIEVTEAWGMSELGIEECYLETEEKRKLDQYFNQNN